MSTHLITIDEQQACDEIFAIAAEASILFYNTDPDANPLLAAISTANAIQRIRTRLTPNYLSGIMSLQGTKLGFLTDRENPKNGDKGYSVDVVRDVLIHALITDFRPTGNEFNIIGGNLYPTKEGFTRKLNKFPGFSDLDVVLTVPERVGPKLALVGGYATWRLNGRSGFVDSYKSELRDARMPIKMDDYSSDDQILGKAKRKLLSKVFEKVTGMALGDANEADQTVDAISVSSTSQVLLADTAASTKAKPKQAIPLDASPEALPDSIAADLHLSLAGVADLTQLTGNWKHWDQKAKNRTFTDGQKVTIRNAFSQRKAELDAPR